MERFGLAVPAVRGEKSAGDLLRVCDACCLPRSRMRNRRGSRSVNAVTLIHGMVACTLGPSMHSSAQHAPSPSPVPPPVPVNAEFRVGAYVFPGWYRDQGTTDYDYPSHDEDSEWRLIAKFARPRPLLGFYDDSLPEVNDWHIKWALEAGITWFAFDWYWNAGEKRLSRSLERGFLDAGNAPLMNFCIHWCNHGLDWRQPLDFSGGALVGMIEYCAENYFTRANYLKIDGRPVFMIWDSAAVFRANGGPQAFADTVLPQLNAVCRRRGLGDLFLVHVHNAPDRLVAVGVGDAITGYSYSYLTTGTPFMLPGSAPYSEMVEALPAYWDRVRERAGLPYLISTQAGWDDTPRAISHGNAANRWVRTDNAPELFEQTLRDAKARALPEFPFVLIEAWNEWGEGSYIEPGKRYGFRQLEAVRRVFAPDAPPPVWTVPSPEQIRSYSVLEGDELAAALEREKHPDPPPPKRVQAVRNELDPCTIPGNLVLQSSCVPAPDQVGISRGLRFLGSDAEGAHYEVTGQDPHIVIEVARAERPLHRQAVALRVRHDGPAGSFAELFYAADGGVFSPARSYRYKWQSDGAAHTYLFRFDDTEDTRGKLTGIRFDPPDEPGSRAVIGWVRVYDLP